MAEQESFTLDFICHKDKEVEAIDALNELADNIFFELDKDARARVVYWFYQKWSD